ncbi:MAG: aldolase/citrate lyase family protein, partial [Actinoplanes sp.]
MRLTDADYTDLDVDLAAHDAFLRARYPGEAPGRQPVHTVYVPADRLDGFRDWGDLALTAMDDHNFPWPETAGVREKLATEPIEDLRVDFEDGYGVRDDDQEDAVVRKAGAILAAGTRPPFVGVRIKSLEAATRRRALRTLDLFLTSYQDTFLITLPKVSGVDQVTAMVTLLEKLEHAYGLAAGTLRFEIQIELPAAVLGADGTATVARLITAA